MVLVNHLDESKPLLTEFGIHHRLESCVCNTENERVTPQIYQMGHLVIKVCALDSVKEYFKLSYY